MLAEPAFSLWLERGREGRPEEVEIAVVGGGIVGLSTAWWLWRAGKKPLLLEADTVAAHASGRNAGFLLTGTAEPYVRFAELAGETAARAFWQVSSLNRQLLRAEILDSGRVDCSFQQEGSWLAAVAGTSQEEELRESAERLVADGFEVEWRDAAAVRRASGSSALGGAIFQPADGGLDPVALCRGMAGLLEQGGCDVRTGSPVLAVEAAGGRAGEGTRHSARPIDQTGEPAAAAKIDPGTVDSILLRTAGRPVRAERAVLALNAYAPRLLPHLAGEIHPVRGQILVTEPAPRSLTGVWYVNDGYEYARQLPDGTFLLGGCRWASRDLEVGYLEAPTATVQGALERFRAATFPQFSAVPVARRWAGTMALTADGLPRVGSMPGVPGAFYAAGLNGHGMSLGFALGRHLAALALGEAPAPLFGQSSSIP